jgi:Tol biopolymer transport system component
VRNGDIFVVNGSGTVTRLTNNGGGQPAWSPDGSRIVFVRSNDIYVMNANGTGVTRLTK